MHTTTFFCGVYFYNISFCRQNFAIQREWAFCWCVFLLKSFCGKIMISLISAESKSRPFLSPCWGLLFQLPVPLVCGQARHLLIHGSAILRAKMCQTSYSYWFMEHDSCVSATWEILVGVLFAVKYINAKLGSSGSPSLQISAAVRYTRSFVSSKLLLH